METGDILIAAAVAGELEGIRGRLDAVSTIQCGRQLVTIGRLGTQAVRLVVTGPGLSNAVHGLTAAVTAQRPGMILQTGCGGGFGEAGLSVGDVAVASAEIDAQLGVEPAESAVVADKLPFPVIRAGRRSIFNRYPVDASESTCAFNVLSARLGGSSVKVYTGPFITVATVTAGPVRSGVMHRCYGALVENMEGAGAAHVSVLYGIPFLEIRAVSNRAGDRDKRRWDLPLAFKNCTRAVTTYLENRPA